MCMRVCMCGGGGGDDDGGGSNAGVIQYVLEISMTVYIDIVSRLVY